MAEGWCGPPASSATQPVPQIAVGGTSPPPSARLPCNSVPYFRCHVEFGVMLSSAGKSLPPNTFGGLCSTYVELGSGLRQGRTEGVSGRAGTRTARPCPAQLHGLGGRAMPCAGVQGILGGFHAPARLEALVQLASNLDLAIDQAPKASTAKTAGSELSAARRRGRLRSFAFTARSR